MNNETSTSPHKHPQNLVLENAHHDFHVFNKPSILNIPSSANNHQSVFQQNNDTQQITSKFAKLYERLGFIEDSLSRVELS